MEQYGMLIGFVLLITVTSAAFALGNKAARGVEQFREERHEHFLGREDK